jgi:hypothetical protein
MRCGEAMCLWNWACNRPFVHPSDGNMIEYGAAVECYWQGKTEGLLEKLFQCHLMYHKFHIGANPGISG